jgi:sec-independent protein translocase protein TatA
MYAFIGVGPLEIAVICLVILLLFAPRLPMVMRNLGQGLVEFKKGLKSDEKEDEPANKT